jgi:hypothetical protein
VLFVAALLISLVHAQAPPQKIAGEVVILEGARLQIKATSGEVLAVKLAERVRLSGRSPANATALAPGAFIGVTATPQPDGTLLAREIHVFPESMRGTGEGHRPMADQPGNTMTNATITGAGVRAAAPADTATNARVAGVTGAPGNRMLTLVYQGGEKTLVVPESVPVAMVEPADRTLLVPGAHVIVYGAQQADGTLAAERVTIGRNGFVPPQ